MIKSKSRWKLLIGDPASFSLEERIFNTILILAFGALGTAIPFNLALGLIMPCLLCLFGLAVVTCLYYLSRYKRRSSLVVIAYCIGCNFLFVLNYYFNSGLSGPNLILFALVFFLIVVVISPKYFKVWLPINIAVVFIVLVVEYYHPQLAPIVYTSKLSRILDFGSTYIITVAMFFVCISYIRKNYDVERERVNNKNISIEGQKLELERLSGERNKLFSIVTHDIRTPLNSIQAYLEVLAESDLDSDHRERIEGQLLQLTKDTSSMLNNFLSWSKTQMEGTRAKLVTIDVREILAHELVIEKNIASRKGVELNIICDRPFIIMADRNMIQLTLRNLVSNAIKFTKEGGLVAVSVQQETDRCCITVKDNGLGIDSSRQENLFKLNASSTYGTNNEKGIGLGLLLSKEFTDLQDGILRFENNPEGGSIFHLSFPLATTTLEQR